MSSSPARRWLRRTGALLAGAPLLAGLLQLPAGPDAHAAVRSAAVEAGSSRAVTVSLDSLSPSVPTDGDTLTVSGTVTNNGRQAVTDAHVGLRVGQELTNRASIDSVARRTGYLPGVDGTEVGGKYVEKFAQLAPGATQEFSISVPVKELDLGSDGVYPLGVSLSGQTAAQPYKQVLGIQRTFLPWQPDNAAKTQTTFLWPLVSDAHMTAETLPNQQQTPVFQNDDLAKEISPGGRLSQLLSQGRNLDVTWVVDPDLLASVDAMAGSYSVKGDGDKVTAGKSQAVAKQWLADLQKAVQNKEVVALPYGDPDLASLAHNGKNVTGSLSHLKDATDVAASTVETILHVKPDTAFAWPVDGAIDPSIIKVATSAGADKVIARSDSLQETRGLSYTPTAARPIGGGTTAVVSDDGLSSAFDGDMTSAASSTLAVQDFLAQSLMINLEEPDKQRSIVVAPPRMPSSSQAQSMAEALTALQGSHWSESVDLSVAAKAKPDPDATTKVPAASRYPSSLRRQELPRSAFAQIENTQDKLDSFKVILTDPARVVTPFGRAIDRSMSTSWRGHASEASAFRQGVESYLDGLTDQVRLIEKSETKLSGRSATIPVTVQNNLMQGVDHLVLRLTSQQPTRLKIGNGPYSEQPISVSGGHSQSVKFTTTANANGRAAVVAQLFTEDGQAYGPPITFDVNVTEITPTVMLVIAGGVLLLVLAGFRMYTQRKRLTARQAEEDRQDDPQHADDGGLNKAADAAVDTGDTAGSAAAPAQESDTETGADDPEHPSDPGPDTAPESTDPSGTGERVDR